MLDSLSTRGGLLASINRHHVLNNPLYTISLYNKGWTGVGRVK